MNPIELKRGDDFKGLSAYLHSGKREVPTADVLAKLTDKQSVFTERDILRHVERDERARILGDAQIVLLESGEGEQFYTTREMIELERSMVDQVEQMDKARGFGVERDHISAAIDASNESLAENGAALSAEQVAAIAHVTGDAQIAAVSGKAGSGKSTMLAAAREAWESQGHRVYGAALAGKAAEELEAASGIESRTLASYQRAWEQGYGQLEAGDVFVMDEAGMVGSRQMAFFIKEAQERGAKIVLVGDEEQLQAINAGAAFRTVLERTEAVRLEDIRRQKEGWQREASTQFATQRTTEALEAYEGHEAIKFEKTSQEALSGLVRAYSEDRQANPYQSRLALAHKRDDVRQLNDAIRGALKDQGVIVGQEITLKTRDGLRGFAAHDRLVFLENNRDLEVKNGSVATVLSANQNRMDVQFDDGRQLIFDPKEYTAIDHGYAMTVHKAQGATVDKSFVYATRSMDRHLSYVAMTRHRESAQMFVGRDEMANLRSLTKNLSRSGAKSSTLDFAQSADQQSQQRAFNAAAAQTKENRVGFSMAMNVGRAAPDAAWKVMQNTSDSAKLLKQANGIRTGKQCSKPVYHYSLTWPESDAPSVALQKQAVRESLKVLGMEGHEAIAVQHLDGKPHVHVMVNLIDPETGMSASTSVMQANGKKASKLTKSQTKLRQWANKFEKANGLQITQGSKVNEAKREAGESVNARRKNRAVYEREQRETRAAMMGWFTQQQKQKGREVGQAQRERRSETSSKWRGVFERFATARAANDNTATLDFVTAAKSLDEREREELADDRAAWRSYGEGRASEFNALVAGGEKASQSAEQSQQRGQDRGQGLSFGFGQAR